MEGSLSCQQFVRECSQRAVGRASFRMACTEKVSSVRSLSLGFLIISDASHTHTRAHTRAPTHMHTHTSALYWKEKRAKGVSGGAVRPREGEKRRRGGERGGIC